MDINEPDITEPNEPDITELDEPDITEPDEPDITKPDESDITEPDEPDIIEPDESDIIKVGKVYSNTGCATKSNSFSNWGRWDAMSIQDIIDRLENVNVLILLAIFIFPPLFAWIISLMHKERYGVRSPWKYFYSFIIYIITVPGILSCVMCAYSIFIIRQNLLRVNIFVYFLPIISMVATLIIVGRNVDWSRIPGVDRLYALMIFLVISFGLALAIQKTRIFIFFGGSFKTLLLVALVCFILLKISMYFMFKKNRKRERPYHDSTDYDYDSID